MYKSFGSWRSDRPEEDGAFDHNTHHSLPNVFSSSSIAHGCLKESNKSTDIEAFQDDNSVALSSPRSTPMGNSDCEEFKERYTLGAAAFPIKPDQDQAVVSQYYAKLFEEAEASTSDDSADGEEDFASAIDESLNASYNFTNLTVHSSVNNSNYSLNRSMNRSNNYSMTRSMNRSQIPSIVEGDHESDGFSFSALSWPETEPPADLTRVGEKSFLAPHRDDNDKVVLFQMMSKDEAQQIIEQQGTFDTQYPILSHSNSGETSAGSRKVVVRDHKNSSNLWKLWCCILFSGMVLLGAGLFVGIGWSKLQNNSATGEANDAGDVPIERTPTKINPPTISPVASSAMDVLERNTLSPTFAPSNLDLNASLFARGDLSAITWEAMEDIDSPQARAYFMLQQDPHVQTYSRYRKLQRFVLGIMYYATNGENWNQTDSWLSHDAHECDWYAVRCGNFEEVSELDLSENGLDGYIPEEIGLLFTLRDINLSRNALTGSISTLVGNLINLQSFKIGWNNITGTIPSEIEKLSSLEELGCPYNLLSGSIPEEISSLLALNRLVLSNNYLIGSIPSEMKYLTNLVQLELQSNLLSSTIPVELTELTGLEIMCAYQNALTGTLPTEISRLSKVVELELDDNQFVGRIPSELGLLTGLRKLWLSSNKMTGQIPEEISKLTLLTGLYLQVNGFSGSIASSIGTMNELIEIKLFENKLGGSIPSELGNLKSLQYLSLGWNALSSTIPSEIRRLDRLIELDVVSNNLQGSIPSELGDLRSLKQLWLFSNNFVGKIPSELGQLTKLQQMLLFWNWLTGKSDTR